MNSMSVSLLRLASGRIALLYLVKNSFTDCHVRARTSEDELRTLSAPVPASVTPGFHVLNNDRAVQLSTGRILAPCAFHNAIGGEQPSWDPHGIMRVFYCDDEGATWGQAPGVANEPHGEDVTMQEPGVVELRDGRVLMWMRTDAGVQYRCFSSDSGFTWTRAEPTD